MPSPSSSSAARIPSQVLAIFDQHALTRHTDGGISGNHATRLVHGAHGVEGKAGIYLGRDQTGNVCQDFTAKGHGSFRECAAGACRYRGFGAGGMHGTINQRCIFRLAGRLENERGIGGGIHWAQSGDAGNVAGIGHYGSHLLQLLKLIHRVPSLFDWLLLFGPCDCCQGRRLLWRPPWRV
jgi:hypothetical protein